MKMDILAESAVRITVLAVGVAGVLRVLGIDSPRAAHRAWTAVVVVMLLLPVCVAWGPDLVVPLLPARAVSAAVPPLPGDDTTVAPDIVPVLAVSVAEDPRWRIAWEDAAVTVYFAGTGLLLLRLVIGMRRARAIRRRAVDEQGRLTSPECVTPMTMGIVAPAVILPPDWVSWDDEELSAVLAHEEEHVRRRDPMVATVALLNRAVFWFHPLAWWLPRKMAQLSEHACDQAVIERGYDSDVYAASLLRFARRLSDAGSRLVPMVTAMPGAGLRERIGWLARPQSAPLSRLRLAGAAVACAVLMAVCAAATPAAAPAQRVSPGSPGQAQSLIETSEHFEIYHDRLPQDAVSAVMREAEEAYARLSGALKYDLPRRVPIILVRRDSELSDMVAQSRDVFPQSGVPTGQRIVISLESLAARAGVIVHELTHQFAFDIVPGTSRVAPFLIEGLAEHQRGTWTAEDLRMTRAAVATGAIPSVASLVAADRHWAHAVFDFVDAQDGIQGVRRLLFALRAHETLAQAVPMAFGGTVDQFDQQFRGYLTVRFRSSQP